MDGLFDIITSMGYRFLINQSSVNNGDIMNIIANDNSVNLSTYFVEILFNKSLFIPINNNGSYQLNNLTSTSNPYLITTAFSIFWVLMFLIFFILLIGVSIYQCVKENQLKSCNKIGVIPSEKPNRNRRKFMKTNWKTILIGLMTVSFFLWIIFLVLLSIEQYVVGSKLSQNLSKSTNANQYNSLTNVIELSLKYFYNMYSIITVDSLNFFNSSASMMSSSVSNQIQSSIKQFIDQILTDFHVNSLFNHVSALINGLNLLLNAMDVISSKRDILNVINQIKGQISVYQSNIASDLQSLCPKLARTSNLYSTCFSFQSSIQQLSIPLLGVPDFISYIQNLSTFVQSAIKLIGMTAELSSLNRTSSNLVLNLPNYNDTQNSMNVMLTKYQVLQSNRNNSLYVNLVIDDIHKVTVNLANDTNVAVVFFAYYNQTIITNMMASIIQIISSSLTSLTNQILPCSNLSTIYEALTTSICTTNNMKDALAALGLLLIMVTVMSQIISLLMVIFTLLTSKYLQNSS